MDDKVIGSKGSGKFKGSVGEAVAANEQDLPELEQRLTKLKRPELQKLCKDNNLRAIGKTEILVESLVAHFTSLHLEATPPKPSDYLMKSKSSNAATSNQTVASAVSPNVVVEDAGQPDPQSEELKPLKRRPTISTSKGLESVTLRKVTPTAKIASKSPVSSRAPSAASSRPPANSKPPTPGPPSNPTPEPSVPTRTTPTSKTIRKAIGDLLSPSSSRQRVLSTPATPSSKKGDIVQMEVDDFKVNIPPVPPLPPLSPGEKESSNTSALAAASAAKRTSLFSSRPRTISTPSVPTNPLKSSLRAKPGPPTVKEQSLLSELKEIPVIETGEEPALQTKDLKDPVNPLAQSTKRHESSVKDVTSVKKGRLLAGSSVSRVQEILKKSTKERPEPLKIDATSKAKPIPSPAVVVSPPSIPSTAVSTTSFPKSKVATPAASVSSVRTTVRPSASKPAATGSRALSRSVSARSMSASPSPRRVSQPRSAISLAAAAMDDSTPSLSSVSIQAQLSAIVSSAQAESLLLHGAIAKIETQNLTLEAQQTLVEEQGTLIAQLQGKLSETTALLNSTRLDLAVNRQMVRDASVDVQSCVSQYDGLYQTLEAIQKKQHVLERDMAGYTGSMTKLQQEMGDVDIALESERDRVSVAMESLKALQAQLVEVGSPKDAVGRKRLSTLVTNGSKSSVSSITGITSSHRHMSRHSLSRASISSSVHQPSAGYTTPIIPTFEDSGDLTLNSKEILNGLNATKPRTGVLRSDFQFPPSPTAVSPSDLGDDGSSRHRPTVVTNGHSVPIKAMKAKPTKGSKNGNSYRPGTPGSICSTSSSILQDVHTPPGDDLLGDEADLEGLYSSWNEDSEDHQDDTAVSESASHSTRQAPFNSPSKINKLPAGLVGGAAATAPFGTRGWNFVGSGRSPFGNAGSYPTLGTKTKTTGSSSNGGSTASYASASGGYGSSGKPRRRPAEMESIDIDAKSISISDEENDDQ